MSQVWTLENNQICIRASSGTLTTLSASEIFHAVFIPNKNSSASKSLARLTQTFPLLSFSRFSPETAIRLTGSLNEEIYISCGIFVGGDFFGLTDEADQIIVNNKWYPLDKNAFSQLNSTLFDLGISTNLSIKYRDVINLKSFLTGTVTIIDKVDIFSTVSNEEPTEAVTPFVVPGLNATLYPYQISGVRFLSAVSNQRLGCILADEMGLGKTLQVIALLQIENNRNNGPSLVIAPATLLENWRRELQIFAPNLKCLVHTGSHRTGDPRNLSLADVIVTSYDLVIRDELIVNETKWNVVVLDEAQNIKNPDAQRTLAVKRINRKVSIAVTGTPIENCLTDLWSVSDFAFAGILGSRSNFDGKFASTLKDAATLSGFVEPLILRRTVLQVANDLPPRIDVLQAIQMTEPMAELYEKIRKDALLKYGSSGAMVATTFLRLVCAHPTLVAASEFHNGSVPKYTRLVELLEEIFARDEKVLIFTSFQKMTDFLMQNLKLQFPGKYFSFVDGRTDVASRQGLVDEFGAIIGSGGMILNPKAAGTGLNITAANHVIHYNPEWNPALTAQSTARAYRRRQTYPVTVHYLYYANTIEDAIVSRADFKRMLAGEVLQDGMDGAEQKNLDSLALSVSPLL